MFCISCLARCVLYQLLSQVCSVSVARDTPAVGRTLGTVGLTTLETWRLGGDQIEVFKILNGYEIIHGNVVFLTQER